MTNASLVTNYYKQSLTTKLYKWLLISFLLGFLFLKYSLQLFPGIDNIALLGEIHHSATRLGFLGAGFFYTYLILQIPAGIICDKFSLHKPLLFSLMCCFLGMMLFVFSAHFNMLFFARMLMGAGAAFATVAYMKAAAIYFDETWFTRLSGFFGTACMGGAGTTLLLFGAIDQHYGFHHMLYSIVYFSAAMVVIAILFNLSSEKKSAKQVNSFSLITLLKVAGKPNNVLLLLYNGLSFSPMVVFGGLWGVHYFITIQHFSAEQAHLATSCLFYGFAIGGPIITFFCQRIQHQKITMIVGILVTAIIFSVLLFSPASLFSFSNVCILMLCIGFLNSSFLLSYSLANKLNQALLVATVIAIVNMGDPIFGGIADPLIGWIFDLFGKSAYSTSSYHVAFSLLILYWLSSSFIASFIQLKKEQTC